MSSKFYTFYDFSYNHGSPPFKPLADNRLKKSIVALSKLHPEWQESDYVRHFRLIFLNSSASEQAKRLAHFHLVAHIDFSRCYLIWENFHHFPFYAAKSEEFHALTNEILWQRNKFTEYLKKYNPQNENKASVKTYILSILKNAIKASINLKSDWYLLCNVETNSLRKINNFGQKLRKALEKYGVQEPNISQYIFAWQYFVPVYRNNLINNSQSKYKQRWSKPNKLEFEEAAKYYNTQRFQPDAPLQVASGKEVTGETLEKWMKICIKALRQAESIIEVSRDADIYTKQIEKSESLLVADELSDDSISVEQRELTLRQKLEQIEANLNTINRIIPDESRRAIMLLCYPHRLAILNQEQLASLLGVNQGTISRFISKCIEKPLVNTLKDLLERELNIELYLNTFLSERFTNPCQSKILDILLIESINNLKEEQQYILKVHYGQKLELDKINLPNDSFRKIQLEDIDLIKIKLKELLKKKLDAWQKKYVKLWLKQYYQNMMQSVLLEGLKQLEFINREIIKKRYCQKMEEIEISKIYPQSNIEQIIEETKQQLQNYLIQWNKNNLSVILNSSNAQIKEVIDEWLTSLIYVEI